ncbi:MAG: PEGA domain-containing protein, partial [Deltaproteobacteria bacterium]|nr:PEGA domain-containing protein [Deltaproteobacteria bacterium]
MASAAKTRRLKRMKTEIGMGAVRPPDDGVSVEEADRLADEYRPSWETDDPDEESGVSALGAPDEPLPAPAPTPAVVVAPPPTPVAPPRPAPAVATAEAPPPAAPRIPSAKATLPLGTAAPSDAELRAALSSGAKAEAPSAPAPAVAAEPAPASSVVVAADAPRPPPAAARALQRVEPGAPTLRIEHDRDPLEDTGRLRAQAARGGIRGSVIIAGSAIIALGIVVSTYLITRRPDEPTRPATVEQASTTPETPPSDLTVGSAAATTPSSPAGEPTAAVVDPTAQAAMPAAPPATDPVAQPAAPEAVPGAPPAPDPPAAPDPPMTRVRLSTSPPGGTLTLDGVTVVNPYEARVPRDGRSHEIGASLEGYEPATRSVTFDREELSVRLTLRRTPPPPPAPVAAV